LPAAEGIANKPGTDTEVVAGRGLHIGENPHRPIGDGPFTEAICERGRTAPCSPCGGENGEGKAYASADDLIIPEELEKAVAIGGSLIGGRFRV